MLRQIVTSVYQRSVVPLLAHRQQFSSAMGGKSDDTKLSNADVPIVDFEGPIDLPLPEYQFKPNEPLATKKQRLVYQSRKRGMLENDLLLSTFIAKYLKDMNAELTDQYDRLINRVTNDWDIFYWATGKTPTPPEYENEIMRMLKEHVANAKREQRIRQPDL